MNRSGRDDWSLPRPGGHHDNDVDEDDYAVPEEDYDDGMVHIQPAKHCSSEYADRSHPRPRPIVPTEVSNKSNTPPRLTKRVIPGPVVNRDLKPGRQAKTKTEVLSKPSVPASPQNQRCPQRPTKPIPVIPLIPVHDNTAVGSRLPIPGHGVLPAEPPTSHITPPWREPTRPIPVIPVHDNTAVGSRLPIQGRGGLPAEPPTSHITPPWREPTKPIPVIPVHDNTAVGFRLPIQGRGGLPAEPPTSHITPPWREQQKTNFRVPEAPSGAKCKPPLSSQRLSLDLESQELFDARQMNRKEGMTEMNSVKRHHHEWPQDKGDSNFQPQKRPAEMSDWYVGAFSRVEAEHALHLVNREGAFLVRDCSKSTAQEPLVLAVFFENRVFNIQIRYSECNSKYTLGTGLRTNDAFDTVDDIIKFHSIFPIALIDGRNPNEEKQKRTCVLMYPVTRTDMLQLLNIST